MILRDYYCTKCGTVHADIISDRAATEIRFCGTCDSKKPFKPVCNGGVGNRFRIFDWPDSRQDPDFYHGQAKTTYEAYKMDDAGNETPVASVDGGAIQERINSRTEERSERVHWQFKRNAGKNRIYLT